MSGSETIVLAGGCFWCTESVFKEVRGVLDVESGYSNGQAERPSYEAVCTGRTGCAEVVKLVYDPAQVSTRQLLEIFFAVHDPTTPDRQGNDVGPQYRSVIFTTRDAQRDSALALIDELTRERAFPAPIVTQVLPAPMFWAAEPEHHDYYANNSHQPYCQYVVAPKVAKYRMRFAG